VLHNLGVMAPASEEHRWLGALSDALDDSWTVDRVEAFAPGDLEAIAAAPPLRRSLSDFTNLRLIQSLWAGVEVILRDPGLRTDIPLARMKDPQMETSMAMSVLAHVLAFHLHHDRYRRRQAKSEWSQIYGVPPDERTITILGLGSMGRAAAATLKNAGFGVSAMVRRPRAEDGIDAFGPDELDARLAETDVLVNVLPVTDRTRDLIDGRLLAKLPEGAGFVNVARGVHVVDDDLLAALDSGHLRHAFLDVFRTEPLPPDHRFWQHPRVTLTPHMAAPTFPSSGAVFVAQQLGRLERGEPLEQLVDHSQGY
jgi:glyoxylate/hydroxypyruvate reductase A